MKAKLREDRAKPTDTIPVWAMDFVHDQLAMGRKLRILTIIDTYSRFAPATDPRFSYKGKDVVQALEHVGRKTDYPKTLRQGWTIPGVWSRRLRLVCSKSKNSPREPVSFIAKFSRSCLL